MSLPTIHTRLSMHVEGKLTLHTRSYYPSSYGLDTYKTQSRGTQEACNKRVASKLWPDPKSVPHGDSQT